MALKFAGYQTEQSVHTRAGRLFAERLTSLYPNAGELEIMPSVTAIGKGAWDLTPMLAAREIDFCYFSSAGVTKQVPSLGVIDLPYAVNNRAASFFNVDGAVGQRLIDDVEALTPLKILGFWDNGVRHITNSQRPIRKPEDCHGLRIRTLNNQLYRDIMTAVGFDAISTDAKDLHRVCASGEVQAQENPLTNLLHFGLHEFHKHVTLTAHICGMGLFMCNQQTFAEWPAGLQRAVTEAAREATLANRKFAADEDAACRAELEKQGVQFVTLTTDERAEFQHAIKDIVQPYRDKLDPALIATYLTGQD
ncbi:MAG: TRAP transporter substrate-binding protein [Rhodospirillales bacterium]